MESELFSDIVFILTDKAGDEKRILAHKVILATASPIFNELFTNDSQRNDNIRITDISAEGFTEFLQLFYKSKVDFTIDHITDVLRLIDKYDVPDCFKVVQAFLHNSVTIENVCLLFGLATSFNLCDDVIKRLESMIKVNSKPALESATFPLISKATMEIILGWNGLNCDETIVFEAVINWAKAAAVRRGLETSVENIKEELGSAIKLIRFPTLSLEQFVNVLEKYPNLLNSNEYIDILAYIAKKRPLTAAFGYDTKRRKTSGRRFPFICK